MLAILLGQFLSPLVLVLIAAAVLSFLLRDWIEASSILIILVLNALIGFFQEFRAEKAIQALQNLTAPRALVWREGKTVSIAATEVVQGDTLILEAGNIVAADAHILQAAHLQINEAILTGESLPVEKKIKTAAAESDPLSREGNVYMGTAVAIGTARAQVFAVGMKTALGKIAKLMTTAQSPKTPMELQLAQVGKNLMWICLGVVVLVLISGRLQAVPWLALLVFSVSLAVAVVPEGLPAIVTVALSLGVRRMAKLHALVRKLPSVETLGSVSVICTDKTGTLTTGQMRVRELSATDEEALLLAAASCCDAELSPDGVSGTGDPTEIAILVAAHEKKLDRAEIEKSNPQVVAHPFDSIRKRMSIERQDGVPS